MSLQLYVKRTVHHQLPNVLALWSKATSLSLVRMALSASQKQNRSPGFSNASQTFRCPQSVLAFVEHLDTKHCGSCTTYPGTCGKKTYYWQSLSQNGCPTCNPSYFLLSFIISYDYSILFLKHFWHSPVHPTKIPAEMLVPKGNTLLLSQPLPSTICCHVTNPWRSKDHTRNDIVQQPYVPRFPDENPQLDNSTLWKIWTFVFPPVFYNCRQGAKRKVTWKGQKQSVPRSRCWIFYKKHRGGCFQKEKHIQNKEDLRWMGYSRYSRTQNVNIDIGEATIWKHFNPKSGLVGHNVGMLRAIETLKQGKKSWTHATSWANYLEKFHSQFQGLVFEHASKKPGSSLRLGSEWGISRFSQG